MGCVMHVLYYSYTYVDIFNTYYKYKLKATLQSDVGINPNLRFLSESYNGSDMPESFDIISWAENILKFPGH